MTDSNVEQKRHWRSLHDGITRVLDRYGRKDAFGKGDYWLVDDNWGNKRHQLEFQNLDLLQSDILKQLQALLIGFPDWYITVRIDVPEARGVWPGMGLILYDDEIVDELQRDYLPERFRYATFGTISKETPETLAARVRALMNKPSGA